MASETLDNLKVLDLSEYISGAQCAKMLGVFGAEVIKIEKPGEGDVASTHRIWRLYGARRRWRSSLPVAGRLYVGYFLKYKRSSHPPTAAGKGGYDDEGVSKANRPHIRSPEAIKIKTWMSSPSFPLYGAGLARP